MFRRVRQVRVHIYLLSVQENSVPLNIWWNGDDIGCSQMRVYRMKLPDGDRMKLK